jgi:cytochrome c biogenesis protein CcdA/DsbC/DsbD-like thiol-disulfide interchange protein
MPYALTFLFVWLGLLAPAPQSTAKLEFHARAEGQDVRAVVRVRVSPRWHLYAPELGTPNVVGIPSKLEFEGAGVQWGEARWPKPKTHEQELGMDLKPATANVYYGTVPIYVVGKLAEGAALDGSSVRLTGQTCEDNGQCLPVDESAKVQTPGTDTLFADFPTDLVFAAPPSARSSDAAAEDFEVVEDPQAKAKVTLFTRVVDGEARAVIRIALEDTWHIYHEELGKPDAVGTPTSIELSAPGVEWGAVEWPEPEEAPQEWGLDGVPTTILQHGGEVLLFARGKLGDGADVAKATAAVEGQTCDPNVCVQFKAAVRSSGAGEDALFAKAASATANSREGAASDAGGGEEERQPGDAGLLEFMGLAVLGGLLALLMPCTYPMIPITISFFTKQAAVQGGARWKMSLLYGVGIVVMFILIGVVVGAPIIKFATHPTTNLIFAAVFVVFGLSLLGLFNLEPPAFLMNAAGQARSTGGLLGIFLMGATLVITSFTCTAPIVGAILPVAAGVGGAVDYSRVVLGMGVFGLTMATPFVFLSLVPGKLSAMPRSGEWMNTLKVTLGFVEVAAALKFVSNADVVLGWQALSMELFLLLWFGIFVVASLYLLGMIRYKGESGEIGGGRLVSGTLSFLFALYCLFGAFGGPLDFAMTALAPPYSAFEEPEGGVSANTSKPRGHEIVVDNLEEAISVATLKEKLLLVNFTGHS